MTPQEIFDKLKENFGESVLELNIGTPAAGNQTAKPVDPYIIVASDKVGQISYFLRDHEDLLFDSLSCLSGVDFGDGKIGTIYHLFSFPKLHKIVIKANVTKENPEMPSVSEIWLTANWHERESFDLIGIKYSGHPDLRRILLPDDWEGHPLRKDYQVPEFYNGMKVPY